MIRTFSVYSHCHLLLSKNHSQRADYSHLCPDGDNTSQHLLSTSGGFDMVGKAKKQGLDSILDKKEKTFNNNF